MIEQVKVILWNVISDLTGETVIWEQPNAPRPALPYWTTKLTLTNRLGMAGAGSDVNVDDDGNLQVTTQHQATLSINRYGDNSFNVAQELTDWLFMPATVSELRAARIAIWDVHPVQDLTVLRDKKLFEARAQFDAMVRFSATRAEYVGLIETVTVTDEDAQKWQH